MKQSGFQDVENRDETLKFNSSFFATTSNATHNEIQMSAKQDYYRLASQFLNGHIFRNSIEEKIFALHSEGVSARNIVKILKKDKLWFKEGDDRVYGSEVKKAYYRKAKGRPYLRAVHETIKYLVHLMLEVESV